MKHLLTKNNNNEIINKKDLYILEYIRSELNKTNLKLIVVINTDMLSIFMIMNMFIFHLIEK